MLVGVSFIIKILILATCVCCQDAQRLVADGQMTACADFVFVFVFYFPVAGCSAAAKLLARSLALLLLLLLLPLATTATRKPFAPHKQTGKRRLARARSSKSARLCIALLYVASRYSVLLCRARCRGNPAAAVPLWVVQSCCSAISPKCSHFGTASVVRITHYARGVFLRPDCRPIFDAPKQTQVRRAPREKTDPINNVALSQTHVKSTRQETNSVTNFTLT